MNAKKDSKPRGNKRSRLTRRRLLVLLLLCLLVAPPLVIAFVLASTEPRRYEDAAQVPPEPVAIVFGAGITPYNTPTPMLADRVAFAVRLYQMGRVGKLLMTGDGRRGSHDEVNVMRRYAVGRGMASENIILDNAGYSTYESCYRARELFGITRAVLVTQSFHLPRALYTCEQLGIDAVGLGTPDWGVYSDELMTAYTVREALAIFKALWDVHILHPQPDSMNAMRTRASDPG